MTPDERPADPSRFDPAEDTPVPWADGMTMKPHEHGLFVEFTQTRPRGPILVVARVFLPPDRIGLFADGLRAFADRAVAQAAVGLLPDEGDEMGAGPG